MITFSASGTFQGVTEWTVQRDGETIGTVSRERPMRWHRNGVGGLVRDNAAPYQWDIDIDGRVIKVRDGASLAAVKTAICKEVLGV